MDGTEARGYLSDDFLDRVRRSYVSHIDARNAGRCWSEINDRRSDVHSALIADGNSSLRQIFADPASTDLFYGVDNLCRSLEPVRPENFTAVSLSNFRGRVAEYLARRVIEAAAGSLEAPIIEIGPGMGRVAYLAYCKGLTDYTTIDLPLGVVAQACFLARVLRTDQIWFQGENNDTSTNCIKLLYSGALPQRRYAIAINVDSLPEMPATIALGYARWLSSHTDLFLSLNQEHLNDFTVTELFGSACSIKPLEHGECAIWPRYFEEQYCFTTSPAMPSGSVRHKAFELLVARRQIARWLRRARKFFA